MSGDIPGLLVDDADHVDEVASALITIEPIVLLRAISVALATMAANLETARFDLDLLLVRAGRTKAISARLREIEALMAQPDMHIGAPELEILRRERDRLAQLLAGEGY